MFGKAAEAAIVASSDQEAVRALQTDVFQLVVFGARIDRLKELEVAYQAVWPTLQKIPVMVFSPFLDEEVRRAEERRGIIAPDNDPEAMRSLRTSVADHARRISKEFKMVAMLRDRELYIKEINHRIKNNLQTVVSMLNIQGLHMKDAPCHDMLQSIQSRIKSIALVYEALYETESIGQIDFTAYAKGLANALFTLYAVDPARIALVFDVQPVILDKDLAMHCGLILNELITNSLKYAFGDNRQGEIRVRVRSLPEGKTELCVSDNGIGLPADIDPETGGSMGLLLINALSQQIHADLKLDRSRGTEFRLVFGKPQKAGGIA